MAGSDWDADSDDGAPVKPTSVPAPAPAYGRKRFDDEDAEDDVKDDWDEEDEEPSKPDVSHLQPMKKKSTVKQKIKEREEAEQRRAELGLGSDEEEDEEDEDPAERRRREKEAQIKADVENAANLLGTAKLNNASDEGASLGAGLKPAKLSTKEEWEEFAANVYQSVIKQHAGKPGFEKNFVPHMSKLLAETMRDVDCRKQSLSWKTIADDKTKAEKDKKAGGGKKVTPKPKSVGTSSAKNTMDLRAYGDEALDDGDDLDFM